jgi:hypothetical protein
MLVLATFYYVWQNNSGMATATATMVLVIITGFYAWNMHLQVETMSKQADAMEKQFTLTTKNIKRDRITKEMNLLILPLKTIYREIESRGIKGDWWELYLPMPNPTNSMAVEKFINAVDVVDQHKYLAPERLYPLIDDFIKQLKNIKTSSDVSSQEVLQGKTRALFESKNENKGGMVEERYNDITTEMRSLDEYQFREN